MKKVFISYSHDDVSYKVEMARQLKHLENFGLSLWDDSSLSLGQEWSQKILQMIGNVDAAILLLSNTFLGSEYINGEEIPKLLQRRQKEGISLYPILVHSCNWDFYEWLTPLNLGPKNDNLRTKPLSLMSEPEQKEFYTKLSDQIFNDLVKNDPQAKARICYLHSEEQQEKLAQSLASRYPNDPDGVMKELVQLYVGLHQQKLDSDAKAITKDFDSALLVAGHEITDRHYRDLIALFKTGLPIELVHLEDLSKPEAEALFSSQGYAALMLGIRLMEHDHSVASSHLRNVAQSHPKFSNCALIAYALGQCHRKLGNLDEAQGLHNLAEFRIRAWNGGHCSCGPKCPKDGLLVEIHRGLGSIFRKLKNWEKAEYHFKIAKKYLTDQVSPIIRSDFLYSYGYFIYEQAVEAKGTNVYRKKLKKAKELLVESHQLRPQWGAPLCRLQIVKQLVQEKDIDYWTSRCCCAFEPGIEPKLTAVICAFAILVNQFGKIDAPAYDLRSEELYEELEQIFVNRLAPKGARICHAFDAEVICEGHDLKGDRWLILTHELLQESAKWNSQSISEQINCLDDFRRNHKLPLNDLGEK